MLSLPTTARRLAGAAVLLAALAVSAPAQAAPTAVERPSATSLNFTLPSDELQFNFARKAG